MDTRDSPILDKTEVDKGRFFVGKKVIAVAIVIILIASAIAMVLPALIKPDVQQGTQIPSSIKANNGQREVTYVVEDMFHMYLPDFDWNRSGGITFEDVNRHQDVDGMPGWFYLRDPGYGEKILRNTYPHIFYYGPYSTMTAPDVDVGYSIWAPYRMRIMAQNVTDCHTRTGDSTTNNVYFVPDLDGNAGRPNTGWINLSYYGTYMTTNSMNAAYDLGNTMTHYARWLFGCAQREVPRGSTNDDGYWFELMGKIQFSKGAAMGFLGWDGTGDVTTWFTANNIDLEYAWFDQWMLEGSGGGAYDIYTAYDYPEDLRVLHLLLDPQNSTADSLVIRMYSVSWGMDAQIVRYLEAANLTAKGFQNWMEDMYLNASISPTMTNATLRATANYHLGAWEDDSTSIWAAAWTFESQHMDWCGNVPGHVSYPSPYNTYDPDQVDWVRDVRIPWTTTFGSQASYWIAPLEMDLETYESIVVRLPTTDVLGIKPGQGTSNSLDATKFTELTTNLTWGTMVLGKGNVPQTDIANAYDPTTKTVTLKGPLDVPISESQGAGILDYGVPSFCFDVSPVAYYDIQVTGPHTRPSSDTVTVTAKNGTGVTVTDWNGTVTLTSNDGGAVFGATTHTFVPGDNGVWIIWINWSADGMWWVNGTDTWFSYDVVGSDGPIPVPIPEFTAILIPVIGVVAIFLVFRTKKRREEE